MARIEIRQAAVTDVATLIKIDHTCETDYVWQIDRHEDEKQTVIMFREIRLPRAVRINYPKPVEVLSESWGRDHGVLVATIGSGIVGYVRMDDKETPFTAHLTDVVVTPRYRRQGVATGMILAAQNWAATRRNKRITIDMVAKNVPGIRLALKLGFEFCGYNEAYYNTQDIAVFFRRLIG